MKHETAEGFTFKKINCNVCGSGKRKIVGIRQFIAPEIQYGKAIRVCKCRQCGLIYPEFLPLPGGLDRGNIYRDTSEYFPMEIDATRLAFYRQIVGKIHRYTGSIGKILDVGCGRGELLHVAQRLGWACWGVDVSSQFVEIARRRFKLNNIIVGTLQEANLPEEFFDVVTLSSVLEFVDDPRSLVDEIYRVMKKGGILYLEDTNDDGLLFLVGDLALRLTGRKRTTRLYLEHPKYQRYGFTLRSIKKLLSNTGFKILDMRIGGDVNSPWPEFGNYLAKEMVNFVRRLIIRIGRYIGKGHLLTIYARKIDQTH